MTNTEIGALLLLAFIVCYWLNILVTLRAIAAFVGTILVGTSGHVIGWLTAAVTWVAHFATTATAWALGVGVPAALTVVLLIVFIHDLHPKHQAGKRTGWAGVALALLIVTGATGIAALNNAGAAVQNSVTGTKTVIGG